MTLSESLRTELQRRVEGGESMPSIARAAGVSEPSLKEFADGADTLTLAGADALAEHLRLDLRPQEAPPQSQPKVATRPAETSGGRGTRG
ncbi:MAG: hypothetical protein KY475_22375 [Planctomycetes bacterium]|nr:hypothetical protein [Planctomycetota bacterium]